MYKKIICLMVIMLCISFLPACKSERTKETVVGDFSLTMTVNKTRVRVGDTVVVTLTLKNLSGKDIPIELTDWQTYYEAELEDILGIEFYPKSESEAYQFYHTMGEVDKRDQKIILKDAIIERSVEYRIEKLEDYEAAAEVMFYIGEDENKELIRIYISPITIDVRRQRN